MQTISQQIDMIALFSKDSKPMPIKFRYEDKEIKINKVLFIEEKKTGKLKDYLYRCQSIIEDNIIEFELLFKVNEFQWILYKI